MPAPAFPVTRLCSLQVYHTPTRSSSPSPRLCALVHAPCATDNVCAHQPSSLPDSAGWAACTSTHICRLTTSHRGSHDIRLKSIRMLTWLPCRLPTHIAGVDPRVHAVSDPSMRELHAETCCESRSVTVSMPLSVTVSMPLSVAVSLPLSMTVSMPLYVTVSTTLSVCHNMRALYAGIRCGRGCRGAHRA